MTRLFDRLLEELATMYCIPLRRVIRRNHRNTETIVRDLNRNGRIDPYELRRAVRGR